MQNLNHLVSLMQEGFTTVAVVFARDTRAEFPVGQQRSYTYKCPSDVAESLTAGDLVIVPPSNDTKLPSIATVVRVDDEPELNFEGDIQYKWLIGKVDTSRYDDIQKKEKAMVKVLRDSERQRQREQLLESYQMSLPQDAESRKLFNQARHIGLPSNSEG